MPETYFNEPDAVQSLAEEQLQLFRNSRLFSNMRAIEVLGGTLSVECVASDVLYKGFPAKVTDNPKSDKLTVLIDVPTVVDMFREYSGSNELSEQDMARYYIGAGLANLLTRSSLSPSRFKALQAFTMTLTEANGLYGRALDSPIFDDFNADEAVRTIVSEGDIQTSRVNAARLITGMFFEVQPNPTATRTHYESVFQKILKSTFQAEELYKETVGLFGVAPTEAEELHTNTIEFLLGISFPMLKPEIKKILAIIK